MGKELPNGWVKTRLGQILVLKNGFAFKSKDFTDSGLPVLRISNIKDGKVMTKNSVKVPKELFNENFIVKNGDILIAMSGATTGKYGIFEGNEIALQNQRVGNLKPLSDIISKKYIYYLLGGLKEEIEDSAYGAAQPNISAKMIQELNILLPPLSEQKRIVAKLDAIFGHLDTLKTKLDRIPEQLKNFRQQVLTQAVTGKLTQEWREGKGLGEWEDTILNNVVLEKPRNGYSPKGVDYVTEVKSLTLSATTSGTFNPKYVKYLDIDKPIPESHLWLKNGDILIQRSNSLEYVGTSAIYDGEDFDFIYPDLMMKVKANQLIHTKYLYYVLRSDLTMEYFRMNASGTAGNMPKINQSIVMYTPVALPTMNEQEVIVEQVEKLFLLADLIESQYRIIKEKIDNLPQAILNKAFKGELVPQDPNDEPASELLKGIQKEKKGKG